MLDYRTMDSSALQAEQGRLRQAYDAFAKRGLKLDMSRGKPAPNQLDLSMGLLAMQDYKDRDGVDMRNYGALEGAAEVREFFAELLGEVLEASTKKNLEKRVLAEHGATQGKKELAAVTDNAEQALRYAYRVVRDMLPLSASAA